MNVWAKSLRIARKWAGWLLLAMAAIAVILWFAKREVVPETIRLATAPPTSQQYRVGTDLAELIELRIGKQVDVIPTNRTVDNVQKLQAGNAELALLQAGATSMQGLCAIAPLYPEPIHVIARSSSNISCLEELAGRKLAVGPVGSGMREDALRLLEHLGTDTAALIGTGDWYKTLSEDETVTGAIITTGLLNDGLSKLLSTGEFKLLPILDAESIEVQHPYLVPFEIPRGMYGGNPAQPAEPLTTVATTAFITARDDVPAPLVGAILRALYEDRPVGARPGFFSPEEIDDWPTLRLHPAVQS